jgi:protein O-mannosyl-transferase
MTASRTATDSRGRTLTIVLAVGLLAILPYLNGLRGDFCFDDLSVIRDNPMVTGRPAAILPLFTTVYNPGALYRPLTMVTYLLNDHLGGGVIGYHLLNIALHMLTTLTVLCIAWIVLGSSIGALSTAALFATHPVHTEAVTSIVGRAELLAAWFSLMGVLTCLRAARESGIAALGWFAVSLTAVAAGMLAKESAFTAIAVCVIVYFRAKRPHDPLRSAAVLLGWAGLALAYLAVRMLIVGSLTLPEKPQILDNPLAHVQLAPRLETALVVLWQYLSQLALPLRLSADYSFNEVPVVSSALDPQFLGALVVFAVLAALLAMNARRTPVLVLAAAFAAMPMALTANILFPIGTIKAERLLYLPSFGWCLACGWLITQVPHRRRGWGRALVMLLLVAYAGRTWARNRDWQNDFTLFAATVQASPGSARAHYNLAKAYEDRGQLDAAMRHFREALAIYPLDADAAFGVGRIYDKQGVENDALNWYARATELNGHLANAHLNIGTIHYRRGDLALAETEFRSGLESEPNSPRLLIGLSLVRAALGDQLQAQENFRRAESMADGDPAIVKLLAQTRQVLEPRVTP